jgi:alkylresorcinol/alkylpyrone synthase
MSFIHAVHTAFPDNVVSQEDIRNLIVSFWPDKKEQLEHFFISTDVKTRHLTLPPKEFKNLGDFGNRNKIWRKEALSLQEKNISALLAESSIHISEIKLIASVNTTGLSVPSLEALLMNKIPFDPFIKRLPIFGLGCLGGVAGINRVHDYLIGHPFEAALLLVTELCSLTFQMSDVNVSNQVGAALFGDGAGAVLLLGKNHRLADSSPFEILGTSSLFYPDTERMMGWDMVEDGFKIVLSPELPSHVKKYVGGNVTDFIRKCGFERKDIDFFVAHPGGPKVLEAVEEVLELKRSDTILSWESLEEVGNVSAVSVINILERTLKRTDIKKGSIGVMLSMGPAFSLELTMVKKC